MKVREIWKLVNFPGIEILKNVIYALESFSRFKKKYKL